MSRREERLDALLFPTATVILVAFLASLVFGFYANVYFPLTVTAPLMLMLAGVVLGINVARKSNGRNGNGRTSDDGL